MKTETNSNEWRMENGALENFFVFGLFTKYLLADKGCGHILLQLWITNCNRSQSIAADLSTFTLPCFSPTPLEIDQIPSTSTPTHSIWINRTPTHTHTLTAINLIRITAQYIERNTFTHLCSPSIKTKMGSRPMTSIVESERMRWNYTVDKLWNCIYHECHTMFS